LACHLFLRALLSSHLVLIITNSDASEEEEATFQQGEDRKKRC